MSGFLLDTNVVSELRKGERANAGVVAWFDENAEEELWLSVLVAGELRRGTELLARRDPDGAATLENWLDSVTDEYADRILPITQSVAERWGVLNVPDPVPVVDGLLAATALQHDLTLVTRNTDDIKSTGVKFVNPFE